MVMKSNALREILNFQNLWFTGFVFIDCQDYFYSAATANPTWNIQRETEVEGYHILRSEIISKNTQKFEKFMS